MARTVLALQKPVSAGLTPVYSTPTVDGFMVSNDEQTMVHVKNANGASCTVTIQTPGTVDGLAIPEKTVVIATGSERFFAFPAAAYNRPAGGTDPGYVYLDFSVQASVSVAALHV